MEEKLLLIPDLSFFNNDLNPVFSYLKKKGYPKWKFKGSLDLSSQNEITSLYNLTEITGNLDISESEISDLGPLKIVGGNLNLDDSLVTDLKNLEYVGGELNFNPDTLESVGTIKEVGRFENYDKFLKAIRLGFNYGTLGSEIVRIDSSSIDVFVDIERGLGDKFFKRIFTDEYYDYIRNWFDYSYYGDEGLNIVTDYYLNDDNIKHIIDLIKNNPNYDEDETFEENIKNCDENYEIRSAIRGAFESCATDTAYEDIVGEIESLLNEIGHVKGREYDNNGELSIILELDYDDIFENWFEDYEDRLNDFAPNSKNLYDIVYEMFNSYFLSKDKPTYSIDERYEPNINKECFNNLFKEYI